MTSYNKEQTRPGGRSERIRKAVTQAVLELIKAGRLDFELQEVARLANVHRTTLYRRWPDRASLMTEALSEHTSKIDIQFSGDWQQDIRTIAFTMRDFLSSPVEIAMNSLIAAPSHEGFGQQVANHWSPLIETFKEPIHNAQRNGEISAKADAAMLLSMMLCTITSFIIFSKVIPDDDFIERLVKQTINACLPNPNNAIGD
jgi:AcrR family transcriptional regulator